MAENQEFLLPTLSIVEGPGLKCLKNALGQTDFSQESPVFFRVKGLPGGIHMEVRKLECVGHTEGDFIVAGYWLDNPGDREIVQMRYSTKTRTGRLTHLC